MVNDMQNKKGFTLVELLGVIVILAIVVTIAVPTTVKISDKIKTNLYCTKINLIEDAAKLYGQDNRNSLTIATIVDGKTYKGMQIKVSDLYKANYLKKDQDEEPYIVDPRDKTSSDLYNMEFSIFIKDKRVTVNFNDEVNETCGK